jgi:NAD+-dependent protein deacetylase sirtuin 5
MCSNSQPCPLTPCLDISSWDVADPLTLLPSVNHKSLPHCPKCGSLLRPNVVWFGERLPLDVLNRVDTWLESVAKIDLMLVLGTTARVAPASKYIIRAKAKGALVLELNIRKDEELYEADFIWIGDVSHTLPQLISPLIDHDGLT